MFLLVQNPVISVLTNYSQHSENKIESIEEYFSEKHTKNELTRSLACKSKEDLTHNDFLNANRCLAENFYLVKMNNFENGMKELLNYFSWKFDKKVEKCMKKNFNKMLRRIDFQHEHMLQHIIESLSYDLSLYRNVMDDNV